MFSAAFPVFPLQGTAFSGLKFRAASDSGQERGATGRIQEFPHSNKEIVYWKQQRCPQLNNDRFLRRREARVQIMRRVRIICSGFKIFPFPNRISADAVFYCQLPFRKFRLLNFLTDCRGCPRSFMQSDVHDDKPGCSCFDKIPLIRSQALNNCQLLSGILSYGI